MNLYVNTKFEFINIFWKILSKKRKRQLIFLQILNFSCALSELLNLLMIKFYLNGLVDKDYFNNLIFFDYILRKISLDELAIIFGLITILVISLSGLLRIASVGFGFKVGGLLSLDIGTKVYSDVINRTFEWHITKNSSEIIGILSNDVERIRDSIYSFLTLIINSILILFIGIPLFLIEPKLMIVLFSIVFLLFATIYTSSRKLLIKEGFDNTKSYQSGLKLINESLGSIRDILINNNQIYFLKNYISKFRRYHLSYARLQAKYQSPRFFVESILICLIIIITIFLNFSNNFGSGITISIMGTVLVGIYKLLVPFQQCSMAISILKSNSSSWEKIKPYFYEKKDKGQYEDNLLNKKILKKVSNKKTSFIELENISFKYANNSNWIIRNFNLSINEGQKVGLVGYSGAGKTTCADLISGLIKPIEGNIFINSKNINSSKINLRNWHNSFSLVPQNIYLLEDSVINNIAFGVKKTEIDLEKVAKVSKIACIHETIMNFSNGYDEIIGEKGNNLSGGQIQRIGIARALYKNSKCIIFDESTSALDNETENNLMQSLKIFASDLTIIHIAHRISTMKNCNYLVFFKKNGKQIIGSYNELMKNSSFRVFLNEINIVKN